MLLKAQVIFLLLIISAHQIEPLINCDDYQPGNGFIVNSICFPNGKVEYSWHYVDNIDGILINYNCTGNTEEYGIAFGFADNKRGTRSRMINKWNYHNSTCYFSGCYGEDNYPFSTYSISSVPCTVLVPSTRESSTPTLLPISTVVVARTISLNDETSLTSSPVRPSNPSQVDMQTITTSVSVTNSMRHSPTASTFLPPMSTAIASRTMLKDDKNSLTFSIDHLSVHTSTDKKTVTTSAILAPTAVSIFIIMMLLLLVMPFAVAIKSRKRRKHLILHGALGHKVDVEDSFDINVKICFSKSLETIPDALFCNEKDLEMRVRVESHIEDGAGTDSILGCGTRALSTPNQEVEKMDDVEEEKERHSNDLAALPPNCKPLKMIRDTSESTSGQNSEYMSMAFSTANTTSYRLDFPNEIVENDFDASNLHPKKHSHGGSSLVQFEIGIEVDFDPMSMSDILFQDEEGGNFDYLFGQRNSETGYDNRGFKDGDVGDDFSGSNYICNCGDTAPTTV